MALGDFYALRKRGFFAAHPGPEKGDTTLPRGKASLYCQGAIANA